MFASRNASLVIESVCICNKSLNGNLTYAVTKVAQFEGINLGVCAAILAFYMLAPRLISIPLTRANGL